MHVTQLAMPAFAIAAGLWAKVFRITRAAVLDVLSKDYIRVARAKGMSVARILTSFVLRNAAAAILTVSALEIGGLLGGTVLVEFVFNWPGLSGLLVESVNARDYPMVVGVVLVIAVLFITLNFLVDVLYGLLDPRVRLA
jgi:peptide/nickel transport system permease protein